MSTLYAVIDVETTGGKAGEEGVTEIAVFLFDGNEIVDQFITLVNSGDKNSIHGSMASLR